MLFKNIRSTTFKKDRLKYPQERNDAQTTKTKSDKRR